MLALVCAGACAERPRSARVEQSELAASQGTSPSAASDSSAVRVETALTLEQSAYGVKLVVSDSVWTLITTDGIYRKAGDTPTVRTPAVMKPPLAVMGQEVVHWGDGQLVATPVSGASPTPLVGLEGMPRDVFASTEYFAWLERSKLGDRILVADKPANGDRRTVPRAVYTTQHDIVSGTMLQDWVFFVEALPDGQWRLGSTSIRKRGARRSRAKQLFAQLEAEDRRRSYCPQKTTSTTTTVQLARSGALHPICRRRRV